MCYKDYYEKSILTPEVKIHSERIHKYLTYHFKNLKINNGTARIFKLENVGYYLV